MNLLLGNPRAHIQRDLAHHYKYKGNTPLVLTVIPGDSQDSGRTWGGVAGTSYYKVSSVDLRKNCRGYRTGSCYLVREGPGHSRVFQPTACEWDNLTVGSLHNH